MYDVRVDLRDIEVLTGDDAPLVGRLWIRFPGRSFPGDAWSDFIASVVSSTVTALRETLSGEGEGFAYFFDGPYYVYYRLLPASAPSLYIEANCDGTGEPVSEWVGEVPLAQVVASWLSAVEAILARCAEAGLSGAAVAVLQRSQSELVAMAVQASWGRKTATD
ncbi:hypothetical protein [Micromonospora sp. DT62]|uniref:hypothetical protein n=1 Tax=Micromonospora sp. DT62 TaxID=3416521 RepID=UPI003CEC1D60